MTKEIVNISNESTNAGKVWDALRLKKLDWYIIGKFLSTFFFAIMIMAVISCVIDYSDKVDNIESKKAPFMEVINYYKNFIPHIVALLFPLIYFYSYYFFYFQDRLQVRDHSNPVVRCFLPAVFKAIYHWRRLPLPYLPGS